MAKRSIMDRGLNRCWDRREVMAGLAAAALNPASPRIATAEGRQSLHLRAATDTIALDPARPPMQVASLQGPAPAVRIKRGGELDLRLRNDLPAPVALDLHGVDGAGSAEPLVRRQAVAAGAEDTFVVPLRQAGTFLCDVRLLGAAVRPLALIIEDSDGAPVDRDEVVPGRGLAAAGGWDDDCARKRPR